VEEQTPGANNPQNDDSTMVAWISQALKFGLVGISNTLVDWALYFALTRWLGLSTLPVLAKAISYGAGIINSYVWNKRWTFRSTESGPLSVVLFFIISLIALGLNAAVLHLGLNVFGTGEVVALITATGFTLLWNFLMSKWVVFRA